jgi:hypothetical protein
MSLEFNTATAIVDQSYLNIVDHGLSGNIEVRYETGDNETPVSIGIGPGIYYVFPKDSNNFYLLDPSLDNINYFMGGFDQLINVSDNSLFVQNTFNTGDPVIYTCGDGTDIGGLSSWNKYWVIKISGTVLKLASSLLNAQNNIPINISTIGSGYSHCLFKYKTLTPSAEPQIQIINPTFRSNDVLIVKSITTTERNNLSPLVNGMLIYNSTIHKFQGRENGAWVNLYEQP